MKSNLRFSRSAPRRLLPVLYGIFLSAYSAYGAELPLKDIKLRPGFEISLYAGNLPNARSLTLSPKGTLFVGSLKEGKVYAVVSQPGETEAKKIVTIAQGLNMPNGV
ncbi:MAG TPA: sorbosone dehydrogenase family protein, partial [Candidatus Binatia bacterium]